MIGHLFIGLGVFLAGIGVLAWGVSELVDQVAFLFSGGYDDEQVN